jgi:hypothetical protein
MFEEQRRELSAALSTIQRAKSEIQQLRSMQDSEVLAKARVIGCTTTKAAMCKQLLDEVSAGVILVEGTLMFTCDAGSCYSHHTEPDLLALDGILQRPGRFWKPMLLQVSALNPNI